MEELMNVEIKLNDLLNIQPEEIYEYKVHLAAYNGYEQPLDVFSRSFEEWTSWNSWRGNKNDFTRKYILSLIPDYHRPNKYIFGGIFEILEWLDDYQETEVGYKLILSEKAKGLIGRLVVDFFRYQGMRGRAFYLENYIDAMTVSEVTEKSYCGEPFPGYDNIIISFASLEGIVNNAKQDWKIALENFKGVYLITDKSNGKRYVGSAYGDSGIWARWSNYIYSGGHGGNDELVEIIDKKGTDYARQYFQFTLLELLSMKTDDESVILRESFWKDALLTRGEYGYNKN